MELVLDTSDVATIKELSSICTISGVTTNPKIIIASGKQPREAAKAIIDCLDDDQKFFMQVVATDYDGIMADAHFVAGLRERNAYPKIPCTPVGLRAIKDCVAEGIPVLGTVVFSAEQGFMGALNGAEYLAPYVNRMSMYGDGLETTVRLIDMLRTNGLPTKVMGASWHNVAQVRDLIEAGIGAVTLPPALLRAIIQNPTTQDIVDDFASAWQEAYGRSTIE